MAGRGVAACWVVVGIETRVGLRIDLMVGKMATKSTVWLTVSWI